MLQFGQQQLIIIIILSVTHVESMGWSTSQRTSSPFQQSSAGKTNQASDFYNDLKPYSWNYELNPQYNDEVSNELKPTDVKSPVKETTDEHPYLHPYVNILKTEMDDMVHQRQSGSNKERSRLPTHIVALEPSTLTTQDQNTKMEFNVSNIANVSTIRQIKLIVLIDHDDDHNATQNLKVELLKNSDSKITLNNGPQRSTIIESEKNNNRYALLELEPQLTLWWLTSCSNTTHIIRLAISQPFHIRPVSVQRPLLILYYVPGDQERHRDAEMFQKMKAHGRKVRSPHTPPKSCKRCVYAERKVPIVDNQPHQYQTSHHDQGCVLHKWFVYLKELNWDTMLIAPYGIYANYCSGRCYAPINNLLSNSSYNAVIRSLYNSNNQDGSKTVPAPHCVPTKLKSATFIYTENNGTNINFKELADVEALECGCR